MGKRNCQLAVYLEKESWCQKVSSDKEMWMEGCVPSVQSNPLQDFEVGRDLTGF